MIRILTVGAHVNAGINWPIRTWYEKVSTPIPFARTDCNILNLRHGCGDHDARKPAAYNPTDEKYGPNSRHHKD